MKTAYLASLVLIVSTAYVIRLIAILPFSTLKQVQKRIRKMELTY